MFIFSPINDIILLKKYGNRIITLISHSNLIFAVLDIRDFLKRPQTRDNLENDEARDHCKKHRACKDVEIGAH